jgi:hypothetical protein
MAQAIRDKALNIAYLPFLSSTRTKQLASLLAPLPYTFLPITNTSLTVPPEADLVLLSRGGKPFAPVHQRPSIDSKNRSNDLRGDWIQSSKEYSEMCRQWGEIQRRLPLLVKNLRRHFSEQVIQSQGFSGPFKKLANNNEIPNVTVLANQIKEFKRLRDRQLHIYPLMVKTAAPIKLAANEKFRYGKLRHREEVIERDRDQLDLFRFELESRFKGMAMVMFPTRKILRPFILVPEDPVGAWGEDFPYRVGELIELGRERFLLGSAEKEELLEQQAREVFAENAGTLLWAQNVATQKRDKDEVLAQVKEKLREDKEKLYRRDTRTLSLNGQIGLSSSTYKLPWTREGQAVYDHTNKSLVKRGSWRVED